jgi:hypothetical protein
MPTRPGGVAATRNTTHCAVLWAPDKYRWLTGRGLATRECERPRAQCAGACASVVSLRRTVPAALAPRSLARVRNAHLVCRCPWLQSPAGGGGGGGGGRRPDHAAAARPCCRRAAWRGRQLTQASEAWCAGEGQPASAATWIWGVRPRSPHCTAMVQCGVTATAITEPPHSRATNVVAVATEGPTSTSHCSRPARDKFGRAPRAPRPVGIAPTAPARTACRHTRAAPSPWRCPSTERATSKEMPSQPPKLPPCHNVTLGAKGFCPMAHARLSAAPTPNEGVHGLRERKAREKMRDEDGTARIPMQRGIRRVPRARCSFKTRP